MKNVKGIFEGIGNLFSNPKLKGIAQIIFWVIFFFIVAMIFRSSKVDNSVPKNNNTNNNSTNTTNNNSNNAVVNSYEYEYIYSDVNNNTINIKGTYYNGRESFEMNGEKYYQINNTYYASITNVPVEMSFSFDEYRYDNIKYITDHNSYINQTKYKNGIEKYEYTIDSNTYNNYYNRNYTDHIIISITKNNNIITDATIEYVFGTVKVKYTNINEIDSLDINVN